MGRLVDEDKVIAVLIEEGWRSKRYKLGETWELNLREIKKAIATVPTVHPKPQKKGKWIIYPLYPDGGEVYMCSKCGKFGMPPYWNYCPNCGAKMEKENEMVG